MTLIDAKMTAWSAAHMAARCTETMYVHKTGVDDLATAKHLLDIARNLVCAAMEIEARLKGVPEPKMD